MDIKALQAAVDNLETRADIERGLADFVICALRLANAAPGGPIDLERAIARRIEGMLGAKSTLRPRVKTNIAEVDRVLSGGIPRGAVVLVGGFPGVGKTGFTLAIADAVAVGGRQAIYYSGEQVKSDLAAYCRRFSIKNSNLLVNACSSVLDITEITGSVDYERTDLVIVDSLQTAVHPDVQGPAASKRQCDAVIGHLTEWARARGVAVLVVSHVNRDGRIAGSASVEHVVDGTLELDFVPERTMNHRRLTSGAKFRLGESFVSTEFEMTGSGVKFERAPE